MNLAHENERSIVVQGWSETESLMREQGEEALHLPVIRVHKLLRSIVRKQ